MYPVLRMIWQPGQYVFEPCIRINSMSLAGAEKTVKNTGPLCRIVTASEQIVFPAYGYWSDAVLYFVVVRIKMMSLGIDDEFIPAHKCIFNGFPDRITRECNRCIFIEHPYMQRLECSNSMCFTILKFCLTCQLLLANIFFNGIHFAEQIKRKRPTNTVLSA